VQIFSKFKKLLDLISEEIFPEGEERLLAHADHNWLDTGTNGVVLIVHA
jgi:hypothetical protein